MAQRWQGGGGDYQPHRPPVNPRRYADVAAGPQAGAYPPAYQPGPPAYRPERSAPPPAPPRPRRRRGKRIAGVILVVLLLILGGLWFYIDSSVQRVNAITDYDGRPAQGTGTNWLIVGSDSRQGLTDAQATQLHTGTASDVSGGRTDTIILVHLPDNSTKPTMVSLLRDSLVSIPGHGKDKINAAYAYGGPQLLIQTVEQATGLRIDHYAEIGLGGFASVVDDVGGVTMCLPQAVDDAYAGINLPAGCQNLNGANALGYVRSRHAFATSDFARTEHQREFLGALANRIASPAVLLNPFDWVPLLVDLPKALTVDQGDHLQNLLALGWAMRGISSGGVVTTAVPTSGSSGGDLLWDKAKASDLFTDLNTDQPVPSNLISNN